MKNKKYLNSNGEELSILHFPGVGFKDKYEQLIQCERNREIIFSDNLSIISPMNKSCLEKSILAEQCKNNNKELYNSAYDLRFWDNTKKIEYILKSLNEVQTEYVLISDGKDVCIVNDLDDNFLDKIKIFPSKIIFNATSIAYPKARIEDLQYLLQIEGSKKYLNAGVAIGTKNELIEFYSKALDIKKKYPNNDSEQFIIRLTQKANMNDVCIDSKEQIFKVSHYFDTKWEENNGIVTLI